MFLSGVSHALFTSLIDLTENKNAVFFNVRVVPRAAKSEIVGEHDGLLKIRINSPPVDGAANAELIKLLAKVFDISKSDIEIISGLTSETKRIKITNLSQSMIREKLK